MSNGTEPSSTAGNHTIVIIAVVVGVSIVIATLIALFFYLRHRQRHPRRRQTTSSSKHTGKGSTVALYRTSFGGRTTAPAVKGILLNPTITTPAPIAVPAPRDKGMGVQFAGPGEEAATTSTTPLLNQPTETAVPTDNGDEEADIGFAPRLRRLVSTSSAHSVWSAESVIVGLKRQFVALVFPVPRPLSPTLIDMEEGRATTAQSTAGQSTASWVASNGSEGGGFSAPTQVVMPRSWVEVSASPPMALEAIHEEVPASTSYTPTVREGTRATAETTPLLHGPQESTHGISKAI